MCVALLFMGCVGSQSANSDGKGSAPIITNREDIAKDAKLLRIAQYEGYRVMEIINAWDTTRLLRRYILINKDKSIPKNIPNGEVIRTPINRVVAYTAVDIGSLSALNELDKVVGVCEARYIQSPVIQDRLREGKIADLGSYVSPNIEMLLSTQTELIIATPYEGKGHGVIEEVGTPIADCASYLEKNPLARSEWIKFYAEFFEKQNIADTIYSGVKQRYNATVELIKSKVKTNPKILPEKRYGQVWFLAAGDSYSAQLYRAAGGYYPWQEDKSGTTIPLSFEEVYSKAYDADIWIFGYTKPNGELTLKELQAEYDSYSSFKAFKNGGVYACNTEVVPFYEESPLRPDLVLMDIAKMLHPQLFKEHTFVYYKNIK